VLACAASRRWRRAKFPPAFKGQKAEARLAEMAKALYPQEVS
jgi:hypothetical protein